MSDVPVQTEREQVRGERRVENFPLRHPGGVEPQQVQDHRRAHEPVPRGWMRTPGHQSGVPGKAVQICLRYRVRVLVENACFDSFLLAMSSQDVFLGTTLIP